MSAEDPRWPRRPSSAAPANAYRSGFGAPRWPERKLPAVEPDDGPVVSPRFGGDRWVPPDGELEDDEDSGSRERGRRRRTPTPSLYPRLTVAALGGKVTVRRDANGVPHINAASERDAYCALGVCMAQDRIWQMDLLRRLAAGRAAELLGPKCARADVLARAAGISRRAAAAAVHVDGVSREILAAFVGGVNVIGAGATTEETQALSYAPEPWTIADCLSIELYFSWLSALEIWPLKLLLARAIATVGLERARWMSSSPLPYELASDERVRLFRRIDPRIADLADSAPRSCSGTAWAVSRERGASGALLSADRALAPSLPPPVYLTRLEAPGLLVAGSALVGTPLLQMGRNRSIAWATVPAPIDDVDVVIEELDGIGNYRTEDGWKKLARRKEVVRVRGGESLRFEVAETRNGPLLSTVVEQLDGPLGDQKAIGVALRWGPNAIGSAVAGSLAVARAASIDDVAAASTSLDRSPQPQTVIAADADGAVGTWTVGNVAVRPSASRLPVRGWLPEGKWSEVSGLSVATKREQDRHVVVAACTIREGDDDHGYPIWGFAASPHRHDRILEALGERTPVDLAACEALQRDVVDLAAREVRDIFCRALGSGEISSGSPLAIAREILDRWDSSATPSSGAAALLYGTVHGQVLAELFPESRYGALARRGRIVWPTAIRILTASSSPWFAGEAERDQFARSVLEKSAADLAQRFGPDPSAWTWGELHTLELAHPLAPQEGFSSLVPPWRAPGSTTTILQHVSEGTSLPLSVVLAPMVRMVTDLSLPEARFALATGQSGRIGNASLTDQVGAWQEGRYLTISLGPEAAATGDITELIAG